MHLTEGMGKFHHFLLAAALTLIVAILGCGLPGPNRSQGATIPTERYEDWQSSISVPVALSAAETRCYLIGHTARQAALAHARGLPFPPIERPDQQVPLIRALWLYVYANSVLPDIAQAKVESWCLDGTIKGE